MGTTPISASELLQHVFERDDRLIDIIASHSRQLSKLRHSPMRRIMARVTTVAHAARLCGMPAELLVAELNEALGIEAVGGGGIGVAATSGGTPSPAPESAARPDWARDAGIELDVREALLAGREPFSQIMAAIAALKPGEVLHLRTTFEPVPLFTVLAKRGFAHHAEQLAAEDWLVSFRQLDPGAASDSDTQPSVQPHSAAREDTAVLLEQRLDVRGLEPPEPMTRTLEALETLPATHALLHVNVRVPQLLLPILRERGFDYSIDESAEDVVYVRIWRDSTEL